MRNYTKQNPLLLTPGPTMVPDIVTKEIVKPIIPHRSKEFSDILKRVYSNLKYLFQTENDVFIFPSSGTGAMCGALENLINPNDKVLSLVCGVFGERWSEIAQNCGAKVDNISVPYGQTINPEDVEKYLSENPDTKIVTITHSETSTGALNNIKTICSIIKKYDAISVVDGISSVGVTECKTDNWGVDVLVSASQKGLMCPPGLSFLCASPKAWEIFKQCKNPSYYFNWDFYKNAVDNYSVPCTPAISLIKGLDAALRIIKEEKLENIIAKHELYSHKLHHGLKNMGMGILTSENNSSPAVTAILTDKSETIRQILKEDYNILTAPGQKDLYGKIFRIGTIGDISEEDIDYVLFSLEQVLIKI